jgi:hypothetical protein
MASKARTAGSGTAGRNGTEQPVDLVIDPCRKVEFGWVASVATIAERQSPQSGVRERNAVGVEELAKESARREVEGANVTIILVAYEKAPTKRSERRRRESHAPRRIKRAPVRVRAHATQEVSVHVESVYDTASRNFVFVRDEEHTADLLNVVHGKARRQVRVRKRTGEGGRCKRAIEDVDSVAGRVGGVEEIACAVVPEC